MHKVFLIGTLLLATAASAQQKIDFESYNPPSTLVVPQHPVTRAKFPFIDVHNHQFRMPTMDLNTLTTEMDKLNMRVMVNLSGGSGDNITDDESRQFNNWRDLNPNYIPLSHTLRIATNIMIKEKVNLEDAATLYAKLNMAASDAIGAVFYSKFHYFLLRPVTYIRGVMGYSTWISLPSTPQTPSYPDELAATASSIRFMFVVPNTGFIFDGCESNQLTKITAGAVPCFSAR